ncbi:hypothetical protein SELMODRAFT_426344 [Selaginella moellendorffii]|uniref:Uncharacterized protein n=1 Tax=Selaginella moellendorffii TaxID=88036 RepID=D8SW32_SELML|nr:hypothetical protein SELMODRAFT_426344 [Selaginella moellendorffii]
MKSASLGGTVRAWDLMRYRNFKTFTTPAPTQFVSLAADQSGEIICAGTHIPARLVDVLNGHKGPVHARTESNWPAQHLVAGVDGQVRGKLAQGLPGAQTNAARPIICTKCLRISPTGRSLAAAYTEGLYSMDNLVFDPTDLDVDVTPGAINDVLESKRYSRALMLALRLNKPLLIQKCVEAVVISGVVCNVSLSYLGDELAQCLEKTPHLEFLLELCIGRTIQSKNRELMPALKSLSCSNNHLLKRLPSPLPVLGPN